MLIKKLLLIDIWQSLFVGVKAIFAKRPVTYNLQTIKRNATLFGSHILVIDSSKCIACKACMKICPNKCINIINTTDYKVNTVKCSNCHLCQKICPKRAISFQSIPHK